MGQGQTFAAAPTLSSSPPRRVLAAAAVVVLLTAVACAGPGDSVRGATSTTTTIATSPASPSSTAVADEAFGPPVLLGQVSDPVLAESSGLVASRRNPGLLWTHNDSGDDPRLYCLTRQATRCGTWSVAGADAFDWEDMAAGPGPVAGTSDLYLGDIGDNRRTRPHVTVYRVAEPVAPAAGTGDTPWRTAPAVAVRLRYEDGPHDAEALLVHPATGDLYVITKDLSGAGVYKAGPGSAVLTRVGGLDLGLGEVVSGADIAPDGRRVVVCTYRRAYELTLPVSATELDRIWEERPRRVELAARAQGEAVAYRLDGGAVLTTSERSPFPLHEVTRR